MISIALSSLNQAATLSLVVRSSPLGLIDKVITVFSNGFYATVISDALGELKDGVPVQ